MELELATPTFSGPLALLLELIESRRLPITEVSLSQVADQYLERMHSLMGVDADVLADFLVIAARLLLIKSRALLPRVDTPAEEPDVAADLQKRLLEYRLFRDAAEVLRGLEESGRRSYPRGPLPESSARPEPPLEPLPPEALRNAMARMLKALRPEPASVVATPRFSVQDKMEHLLAHLTTQGPAVFSELAGSSLDELVAAFLAVLELLRRGDISAEQDAPFGEIRLSVRTKD